MFCFPFVCLTIPWLANDVCFYQLICQSGIPLILSDKLSSLLSIYLSVKSFSIYEQKSFIIILLYTFLSFKNIYTFVGHVNQKDVLNLYLKGLIYFDIFIDDNDHLVMPPLEGFVMNRVTGDYFEETIQNS